LRTSESEPWAGTLNINRRFVTIAVWCREIALPAAVLAVLVAASSTANNVYSLAVADVTPVATDIMPLAASVPLSDEPVTATINPVAAREADAPNVDAPDIDAPAVKEPVLSAPVASGPVLAALEAPEEKPPKPSPDGTIEPANIAGPKTEEVYDAISSTEIVDECMVIEICVDRYLWQLYERTPKEDSVKESTERRVTIKKKGKLITVTRTSTVVVDEDFGWKDPKAAKNAGRSVPDYVIGGVDRDFKLKLFQMLRAADQAGLAPGITSAFRDDYRQSIASGLKAADNRSYHGGSLRGGYGHGLAADIVSIKGATRKERLGSSEILWKWIDDHGRDFGLGRPYLDRDPPHVAPIDGEEYARHRPGVKTRQAAAAAN
jgi:hypothetical protein